MPTNIDGERYYSLREVYQKAEIARETLRLWIKQRKVIPPSHLMRRDRRKKFYTEKEFVEIIKFAHSIDRKGELGQGLLFEDRRKLP